MTERQNNEQRMQAIAAAKLSHRVPSLPTRLPGLLDSCQLVFRLFGAVLGTSTNKQHGYCCALKGGGGGRQSSGRQIHIP